MNIREIRIDGTRLQINGEDVENCSVKGFAVSNDYAEEEIAEVTITLLAPKTDVVIAGLLSSQ